MERERTDYTTLLDVIATESGALVEAALAAGPDTAVPGCPGWTVADLVWHLGETQDFWRWVVGDRVESPAGRVGPARPPTFAEVVEFAREGTTELLGALAGAEPATVVWTWSDDRTARWVARRQAHEMAVHRVDAEAAAGRDHRLDPALAADGIDELLSFAVREPLSPPGSVHLHCTDADGEWTIAAGPDGRVRVSREHAKGDAALRGPAHDLLMVLWRRAPLEAVTVFGDGEVATQLVARLARR